MAGCLAADLVKIASNLAVPVDTPATDVVFGMADDTNPVVSLLDTLTQIKVIWSGIVRLVLKSGDVLAYDAKVYIGVDAQTVTVTDPGGATAVGRSRELSSVTGDGSIRVKIDLNVRSNA